MLYYHLCTYSSIWLQKASLNPRILITCSHLLTNNNTLYKHWYSPSEHVYSRRTFRTPGMVMYHFMLLHNDHSNTDARHVNPSKLFSRKLGPCSPYVCISINTTWGFNGSIMYTLFITSIHIIA